MPFLKICFNDAVIEDKQEKENKEEAGYHPNSLGERIKLLGDKQDTLGHQRFWYIKGKSEQLLGP